MTPLPDAALDALRQMLRVESDRSAQEQALHRLHCVCLVACGHPCSEVAAWFGDSPRSLQRWVRQFHGAGLHGLATPVPARSAGRPARLAGSKLLVVVAELGVSPRGCGYAQAQWDGKLLQRHLQEHHDVRLSLRQCQRTLHDALAVQTLGVR